LVNRSPVMASVLAIIVVGEQVTVPIVIGTLVIVAGTTLLSAGGRSTGIRLIALLLPLTSAACFGVVAILRKLGLMGMTAVFGFAVNVTAALVAYTAFLIATRQGTQMFCRGQSLVYFILAGVPEDHPLLL